MAEHYCRHCRTCDCDCGRFDGDSCQYCSECAKDGWSPDPDVSVVFAHRDGIFANRAGETTKLSGEFQNAIHKVAYDFVRYYVEGTEGCRNCGGFPHSSTCFVGRFEKALVCDHIERNKPPDTVPTPLQVLRGMVEKGSQVGAAENLGVSPQFINDVLSGRRGMTRALADKLGYQRVVTFLLKPETETTEADYCDDCHGYHKTGKCSAR